jgi:hypothetical protein
VVRKVAKLFRRCKMIPFTVIYDINWGNVKTLHKKMTGPNVNCSLLLLSAGTVTSIS